MLPLKKKQKITVYFTRRNILEPQLEFQLLVYFIASRSNLIHWPHDCILKHKLFHNLQTGLSINHDNFSVDGKNWNIKLKHESPISDKWCVGNRHDFKKDNENGSHKRTARTKNGKFIVEPKETYLNQ